MNIKRGRTSQIVPIRMLDITSVSGGGKTGLVWNSANLTAYYKRELDATATVITLATMTAGTWVTGGFVEEDATHLAGQYSLGLPNAALGSSDASTWVEVMLYDSDTGLGIAPSVLRLDLVAYDPQDATRLGLTALPNAAAEAAGGLYTRGSGAGQINQPGNGLIDVSLKAILNTALTETAGQLAAAFKQFFNIASPTSTMNTITAVTTATTATNLTNAPTAGDFTAAMKTSLNASTPASITGAVGSVTGNVGGNVTGSVGSVLGNVSGNVVGSVGSVAATVAANLTQILGTALTETVAGYLAAAFKKFFNVASPTSTMNEITLVDTTTALTNAPPDSAALTEIGADVDELIVTIGSPAGASIAADIAEIEGETDAIKMQTDKFTFTGSNVNAAISSGSFPTVQQIVNGVWDEPFAPHSLIGSFAAAIAVILDKVGLIGSGMLFSSVPVAPSGAMTITAGSSYYAADGLALIYTLSGYPDLDVGTGNAEWHAVNKNNKPVVIVGDTIAVNQLRFELSPAQSAPLDSGSFSLKGSIAGSQHTLKTPNSKLTVLPSH